MTDSTQFSARYGTAGGNDAIDAGARLFAWINIAILGVFALQTFLIFGAPEVPAPSQALEGGAPGAWVMAALYPAAAILAGWRVLATPLRGLREDADLIAAITAYIIRGAFFAVLYIGIVDAIISFLRVEELLAGIVGDDMASDMGRSAWRGPYIHVPLLIAGFATGLFSRTLGFTWLALLIVVAEFMIVVTRFIFSYEQAFMGDLVRFWYAALFLFASAYTLLEEGHVRVDVVYAGLPARTRGWVNAAGSVFLGIALCWTILVLGMGAKSSIITAPLSNYEVSQSGFGMYVKYWMAGFLALFAGSMLIQFCSYFLDAVADLRGQPGGRDHDQHANA